MRRDGALNRERLLTVAREVFAARGAEVPLEDVASAAGVSRTTLYRHFATREELAAIVYEENVALIEQRALQLADADDGVIQLLDFVFDMQQHDRSFTQVITTTGNAWFESLSERTEQAFAPLVDRAARAGLMQQAVEIVDIMLAFPMFASALNDPGRAERGPIEDRARATLHRGLFVGVER